MYLLILHIVLFFICVLSSIYCEYYNAKYTERGFFDLNNIGLAFIFGICPVLNIIVSWYIWIELLSKMCECSLSEKITRYIQRK